MEEMGRREAPSAGIWGGGALNSPSVEVHFTQKSLHFGAFWCRLSNLGAKRYCHPSILMGVIAPRPSPARVRRLCCS